FQRVVWIARRRARGGEFGISVLLHKGRAGLGDRECGEAGALRFDSGARAAAGRRPAVPARGEGSACGTSAGRIVAERAGGLARTEQGAEGRAEPVPHHGDYGTFPHDQEERKVEGGRCAAGHAAIELHHRRHARWTGGRPGAETRGRHAAVGDYQWAADGGNVGGAAICGSDEGGGEPFGTVHGEGGYREAREGRAGDGERRCARHREKPGGNYFEE